MLYYKYFVFNTLKGDSARIYYCYLLNNEQCVNVLIKKNNYFLKISLTFEAL